MEFGYSEQQKMFRETAREFAEGEIAPLIRRMEEQQRMPRELIPKMKALGFYGIQYPERYGGVGGSYLEYVMVLEELSRIYCSIGGHISVNSLCAGTILDFGTEEQRKRFLPELLAGDAIGSFAFTEPDTGTDARAIRTTAVRDGDEWVINGEKIFITNSTLPGYIAVFCKDVEADGKVTNIIVPKDTPGYSAPKLVSKMGMRGMEVADVVLQDVRVPYENAVGGEEGRGRGFEILTTEIAIGKLGISAQCVGMAQAALDESTRYAKQREQQGKPIAKFQTIQWMIGEMSAEVEAARYLTYDGLGEVERSEHHVRVGPDAAVRLAGRTPGRELGDADSRRLRLHHGVQRGEDLSRHEAGGDLRGRQRDPARHRRRRAAALGGCDDVVRPAPAAPLDRRLRRRDGPGGHPPVRSHGLPGRARLVHPSKTEILGRAAYHSVEDLPGSPDAAYIGVNRQLTIDIVRDLAARGAGGAICFATGFSEAGDEGAELERRLLEASAAMPLIGPNCYGLLNYLDGAMLWPDQQGGRRVDEGVAIITMSSNVAFNLTMQRRGLPVAYVMSLGNKLKFDLHDAIRVFASEPRVTALGLYVEGISEPRAFDDAVRAARGFAKPVVAVKVGRSEAAQKMVVSHTASLAGSDALVSALFDRAGVARVDSMEALVEALKVLHVLGPLPGGRVGAMSTSGGDLCLLGDAMMATPRLTMPPLSDAAAERVRATVHERIVVANPLDYQMFDWNDEERLAATFSAFVSDDFDVSLCLLDFPREDRCDGSSWGGAERAIMRAARDTSARTAVLSTFSDTISEAVAARLIPRHVVPLAGIHTGLAAVQAAVDVGAAWRRDPRPPVARATEQPAGGHVTVLDEAESKARLARYGIPVPPARVVRDAQQAATAAAELGFPVAVKALGVAHKTDVGGVALGVTSAESVAAAVEGMSHLSDAYLIESMVGGVVGELIVGVARDPQFGPYLVVGGGGVLVELVKDSRSLLLPVSREEVAEALEGLRCAPLLRGFRGAPPADLDAAADAVLAVAVFVEEHRSSIVELDVNPLLLLAEGQGVVAADALISLRVDGGPRP